MQTVLLDVDADFIVGNDYGGRVKKPQVTGKEYGKYLRRFRKKNTTTYLMVDHHEALYHWDQEDVRGALCIHVDAHHDLWKVPEVREPIVNQALVDFQDPRRGLRTYEQIDCGNYLHQAMIDDVVKKVIYVPAPFRTLTFEREDINYELEGSVDPRRVRLRSWEMFKKTRQDMPKADIITIAVSPEWLPRNLWSHVEDLCEMLRVDPEKVQRIKKKAYQKWKAGSGPYRSSEGLDFRFPYAARIM